jgi:hypothetical protein
MYLETRRFNDESRAASKRLDRLLVREEAGRHSRNRDADSEPKVLLQIISQLRRRVACRSTRDGSSSSRILCSRTCFQTVQRVRLEIGVRASTAVELRGALLRPHVEVCHLYSGTRGAVCAFDLDWSTLHAVQCGAGPVADFDVRKLHAVAREGLHALPVLLDIQAVRVGVTDEVLEHEVRDLATSAVRFQHEL